MSKKNIGILTVGRTDYSYLKPVLKEIEKRKALEYYLIAAGMHLTKEFGLTYREIEKDGFTIHEKLKVTSSLNTAEGAARTAGMATLASASVFAKGVIDMLLVLGDRIETLGVVSSAIPYNIPVAHMCGGDVTEGAVDERIRHAITKIAHIHFPTNKLSARRIIQMGEEPWRVFTSGSTSIDMMKATEVYSREQLLALHGLDTARALFLITFHPATLEVENTANHMRALLGALRHYNANMIITYPNSDPSAKTIIGYFNAFAKKNKNVRFMKNLGIRGYYSAMKHADAMIGNSSSGIIESATFRLPVVNIGDRQKNRLAGRNVIDSTYDTRDIDKKIKRALSRSFQSSLEGLQNPYGSGDSSRKIVSIIERILTGKTKKEIITKKFCDKYER